MKLALVLFHNDFPSLLLVLLKFSYSRNIEMRIFQTPQQVEVYWNERMWKSGNIFISQKIAVISYEDICQLNPLRDGWSPPPPHYSSERLLGVLGAADCIESCRSWQISDVWCQIKIGGNNTKFLQRKYPNFQTFPTLPLLILPLKVWK